MGKRSLVLGTLDLVYQKNYIPIKGPSLPLFLIDILSLVFAFASVYSFKPTFQTNRLHHSKRWSD